jgi:hypothetical protein
MRSPPATATTTSGITRGDILLLGISSGISGSLIGGLMLGVGLGLAVQGVNIGWLLVIPAAPASCLVGWFLARRLARKL